MKFLDINSDIIQLEGVRNAFRWNWIERRDGNGDTIGTWCKKINVAGQAYCVFCNSLLKYGGEGFKAFTNQSKTVTHIKYSKCIRHSMTLSNANSKNTDDLLETDARPLDIVTRKARQEVDVTNPEFHLPSKVIFTGAEASTLLKKLSKNHPIAKEFQISLMKAYTNTAQHMKQKLPLKNSYLISFTALDPELRGKTSTILAFEKLSFFMSHIFSDNEKSKVEAEIRLYQSDIDITKEMLYTSDESGNQVKCTIDKYWSKVFNLKDDFTNDYKYPTLAKLVKACLSCFHGPLVESAFNLMDTLVTDYRTSLKIDSLDAVQTIKYDLMASKETSCEKWLKKSND
ncbi:uncharacterized protein TNCV_1471251 [Trichonephila clavipes]|nr:uncharacterized protein TNCV_1471251 [Trichonephila clavipes]